MGSRLVLKLVVMMAHSMTTAAAAPTYVVDISGASDAVQLPVLVCVGLFNRAGSPHSAYVFKDANDEAWLSRTRGGLNVSLLHRTTPAEFVAKCMQPAAAGGAGAKGFILYNASRDAPRGQKLLMPNLVTLAAVLDAVPLQDNDVLKPAGATLVLDSTLPSIFGTNGTAGYGALKASRYVYEHHINMTGGLAKMNPGLDVHGADKTNPPLTKNADLSLTDFIVKERLFNFFLVNGCIAGTPEHAFNEILMRHNPWAEPVTVYGYDDAWALAGDLFEAETNCVSEHNLGQSATSGVPNLSYFSSQHKISAPLLQNPTPLASKPFNATKVYMSFVIGDGDNVAFMRGSRAAWMEQRLAHCRNDSSSCFPLLWSASPQLLHLAPDWLRWFYNISYETENDYFVLPPSGDTYSYPSQMQPAQQAEFVANTERDCVLMNTSASVSWEFFSWWTKALSEYFPRYTKNGVVRSFIAVNVPYMLPVEAFGLDFYKVMSGPTPTVVFRPREWRGARATGGLNELSVSQLAKEINGYDRGTVAAIYTTSDGGFTIQNLVDLVAALQDHVEIVDHVTLAQMVAQKEGLHY
ncbi:hypothetical protein N9L31_00045 [bacterium]|nr:hypothetical protein [bacterium]